ncbi:MAG TPA: thiamine-binding protein [Stackebrandtia sp.]|jgi:uncharacterized protein (TIGR00106 family)|uniref:thiamine-binding protein n=1 Tax=Stackebrandtia sp. TaxID=2023065 RepID=UPI002D670D29|nr:thiamine-binding protein [Stackebrandtia sp.]HZE38800.1 thiamine-binding protein [Stackebrandtia sp.]
MSVLVAFSVSPMGGDEHVGAAVAQAVRVVRESGLSNRTDAMFTTVEGDSYDEVMEVVNRAIKAVADAAPRASAVIKIDYFPGRAEGMESKVATIEEHLGQT